MNVDLRLNYPVLEEQAAVLNDALRRATADELDAGLVLAPFAGRDSDRATAARWLSSPGYPAVPPSRVFINCGGHHAMVVCLLAAELTGAAIAVEPLTYSGLLALREPFDLRMVPCEMDQHGMTAESLRAASRKDPALRAVYLMPTVHNPLGIVMPKSRREEIAAVARERDLLIIEDDAYGFLEADPPPSFALLAPERACYFLSMSKPFASGLKTAFLLVPDHLGSAMEVAIRRTVSGASPLLAGLVSRLIDDGELARIIRAKRADAARRQRLAREILQGLTVRAHPASYHLWLSLGPDRSADEICASLARDGIDTAPGRIFTPETACPPNALRLALGQERDETKLLAALREVARRCGRAGSISNSDQNHASAPPQLLPAPAVQAKQ